MTKRSSAVHHTGMDVLAVIAPGLLLLVATRTPFLTSPRLFPDGDEAIVGLMAQRFLEQGEFPGFFWGQCYGIATLEALAASIPFAMSGPTDGGLKAAALFVFAAGWLAWSMAAERIMGRAGGRMAAILLAAMPAWFAFSMKAWGGMVTAFLTSGLALWMLAPRARPPRIPAWISLALAGFLTALTWFAQPIMAAALAPIVLAREIRPRGWKKWTAFAAPALITALALRSVADCSEAHWQPQLFGKIDLASSVPAVLRGLFVSAHGSHFMNSPLAASSIGQATGAVFLSLTCVAGLLAISRAVRTNFYPLDAACACSILVVLGAAMLMKPESFMYRYLLPAVAPAAWLIASRLSRTPRPLAAALLTALALLAVSSAWTLRNLSFSGWSAEEERAIRAIVQTLRARGIEHALVTHPTLQWNLMLASRGNLTARWREPKDRRPELPAEVDRALLSGQRVSLVARTSEGARILDVLGTLQPSHPRNSMAAGPLVLLGPIDAADAKALGFELSRP